MEAAFFTFCDAATMQDDRLSILATFEILFADNVPFQLRCKYFAGSIRCPKHEAGEHLLKLILVDADGKCICDVYNNTLNAKFKEGVDWLSWLSVPIVVDLSLIAIPAFGEYSMHVFVDGKVVAEVPLLIKKRIA